MHPEEYLDLVDENDHVIGRKLRADIYAEGLLNFRVINVFLINSEGKLWIPRRTAHKAIFPLALDFATAGHVTSGETYDQAFEREVQEELNIDIATVPHRLLGHLTPKEGTKMYEQIYEISSDKTPQFNPDDFIEAYWLTPRELVDRLANGDTAKSDLAFLTKKYYL